MAGSMQLCFLSMLLSMMCLSQLVQAQIDTDLSEVQGSGGSVGVLDFSSSVILDIEVDGAKATKNTKIAKYLGETTKIRCRFSNYETLTIKPENTRLVREGRALPDTPQTVGPGIANFTFEKPSSSFSGKHYCLYNGGVVGQELRSVEVEIHWCGANQFICDNQCWNSSAICNGVRECADGADEHPSRCLLIDIKVDAPSALSIAKIEGLKSEFVCTFSNYEGLDIMSEDIKLLIGDRALPERPQKEGPAAFKFTFENPKPSMSGKYHCLYNGSATLQSVKSTKIGLLWCGANQFMCDNRCRDKSVICNGTRECIDGSDEQKSLCCIQSPSLAQMAAAVTGVGILAALVAGSAMFQIGSKYGLAQSENNKDGEFQMEEAKPEDLPEIKKSAPPTPSDAQSIANGAEQVQFAAKDAS